MNISILRNRETLAYSSYSRDWHTRIRISTKGLKVRHELLQDWFFFMLHDFGQYEYSHASVVRAQYIVTLHVKLVPFLHNILSLVNFIHLLRFAPTYREYV